jgi:hypothetical protein
LHTYTFTIITLIFQLGINPIVLTQKLTNESYEIASPSRATPSSGSVPNWP